MQLHNPCACAVLWIHVVKAPAVLGTQQPMSDSIEVLRYRSNEIEVAKPKKEIRDFSFIATLECLKIVLVLSETVPVLGETVLVLDWKRSSSSSTACG